MDLFLPLLPSIIVYPCSLPQIDPSLYYEPFDIDEIKRSAPWVPVVIVDPPRSRHP